jgi:hypothetical protein
MYQKVGLLLLTLCLSSTLFSRQIWVSPDGSSQGTGTPGDPIDFKTAVEDWASPGDTFNLVAGLYETDEGFWFHRSGTSNAPILYRSYDGLWEAKIRRTSGYTVFEIKRHHMIFDGLEIQMDDFGINITGRPPYNDTIPTNIIIRNCRFIRHEGTQGGHDFIHSSWCDSLLIENCVFEGNTYDQQVDLIGAWYTTVRKCYFGPFTAAGSVQFKGGCRDIIFEKNIVVDGAGIRLGGATNTSSRRPIPSGYYTVKNLIMRNNIIFKGGGNIIFWGCDSVKVLNNTIVREGWVSKVFNLKPADDKDSRNCWIINNIIYNNSTSPGRLFDVDEDCLENFYSTNCLTFPEWNPGNIDTSLLENWLYNQDPQFVSYSDTNFRLKENSPAIDAGIFLVDVPDDYDSISRPQGSNFDIGCFEYFEGSVNEPLVKEKSIIFEIFPTIVNPSENIYVSYYIPNSHYLRLQIFDIQGRLIKTLFNLKGRGKINIKKHLSLPSGTFFINLKASSSLGYEMGFCKKLIVIR